MKKNKVVIISHYHFLYKSESENSVSFWFCSVSSYQIEVQFCFISQKMNLILSHLTEKKFDLISLKLLSLSVSFHFMKKNLILFHLMKIKSDFVSSHWKKIWFCLISQKKNLVLFHFIKKKLILSHLTKKKSCLILILSRIRIRTGQKILISII